MHCTAHSINMTLANDIYQDFWWHKKDQYLYKDSYLWNSDDSWDTRVSKTIDTLVQWEHKFRTQCVQSKAKVRRIIKKIDDNDCFQNKRKLYIFWYRFGTTFRQQSLSTI